MDHNFDIPVNCLMCNNYLFLLKLYIRINFVRRSDVEHNEL